MFQGSIVKKLGKTSRQGEISNTARQVITISEKVKGLISQVRTALSQKTIRGGKDTFLALL